MRDLSIIEALCMPRLNHLSRAGGRSPCQRARMRRRADSGLGGRCQTVPVGRPLPWAVRGLRKKWSKHCVNARNSDEFNSFRSMPTPAALFILDLEHESCLNYIDGTNEHSLIHSVKSLADATSSPDHAGLVYDETRPAHASGRPPVRPARHVSRITTSSIPRLVSILSCPCMAVADLSIA